MGAPRANTIAKASQSFWALLLAALLGCLGLCSSCAPTRLAGPRAPAALPAGFQQVPIGIGEDYPAEARTLASLRRDLDLVKTNGLEVLRISFPWDAIEPEPGRYDWAFWDQLVGLATDEYHLRLIPYVCYTPKWAASDQGPDFWRQPPRDNALFADFVRRLATRYRGRIHSWELWNEPDNREYWLGTVDQFADLLAAGARAVREAAPQAKVVMGGLAWNLDFLEAVLTNAPAITNVDVINLHNYYETWSSDPLERIPEYVGRASDILRSHGKPQPLWMAEVGYSNFRRGAEVSRTSRAFYRYEHTPEHQAASLFRVLSLLAASGQVSLITWYRINDLPGTQEVIGDVNNRYLGVLDAKGRPKPALRALVWSHKLFAAGFRCIDDQVRLTRRISAPAEVHAFERPDGSLVITAWLRTVVPGQRGAPDAGQKPDTRQETIDLALPFTTAEVAVMFNELGEQQAKVRLVEQKGETRVEGLKLTDGAVKVLLLDASRH